MVLMYQCSLNTLLVTGSPFNQFLKHVKEMNLALKGPLNYLKYPLIKVSQKLRIKRPSFTNIC